MLRRTQWAIWLNSRDDLAQARKDEKRALNNGLDARDIAVTRGEQACIHRRKRHGPVACALIYIKSLVPANQNKQGYMVLPKNKVTLRPSPTVSHHPGGGIPGRGPSVTRPRPIARVRACRRRGYGLEGSTDSHR